MDNNHLKRISDSHWDADTLLAYKRGELPEDVRKKLLQDMENDPFLKDAVDGLAEIDADTLDTVLSELEQSVLERTRTRRTMVISPTVKRYLAAAVFLMFLSVTLLVMNRLNRQVAEDQLSYNDEAVTPSIDNPDGMGAGATTTEDFLENKPKAIAPEKNQEISAKDQVEEVDAYSDKEELQITTEAFRTVDVGSSTAGIAAPVTMDAYDDFAITKVSANYYTESYVDDEVIATKSIALSKVSEVAVAESVDADTKKREKKKYRDGDLTKTGEDIASGTPASETDSVILNVEAQYPGGKPAMDIYLNTHMQYPTGETVGTIYVQCTITPEGKIAEPFILQGLSTAANNEAIRVINAMPLWNPAYQNGQAVSSTVVIMVQVERN